MNQAWQALNKLVTIAYLSLALAVYSLYVGKRSIAVLLCGILFIAVLVQEYRSGSHMARYREATRQHIKKQLEKDKERAHIDDLKRLGGGKEDGMDRGN